VKTKNMFNQSIYNDCHFAYTALSFPRYLQDISEEEVDRHPRGSDRLLLARMSFYGFVADHMNLERVPLGSTRTIPPTRR
jgi:hypothetical protein